ncbi:hypothetical protein Tco_1529941 [Tanacetum coccineum]
MRRYSFPWLRRLGLYHAKELEEEGFDNYFQGVRFSILRVLHKRITYGLCQRTTRYEKIQRNDLWLLSMFEDRYQNGSFQRLLGKPEVPVDDVLRVAAQRASRVQRASMYQGVFENMGGVYSVPLQGAYNPPSYAQPQYDQYYQQYYPHHPPQQQHDDAEEE